MAVMRQLRLVIFLCASSVILTGSPTFAQLPPTPHWVDNTPLPSLDRPIGFNALSHELADKLVKAGRSKVILWDFDGPDLIWSPFSDWLADQFSIALKTSGSALRVIDRSKLAPYEPIPDDYGTGTAKFCVAQRLGADTIIEGTYRPAQNWVGVTLNAYPVICFGDDTTSVLMSPISTVNGKIPFTQEIGSKVYLPLDALWPENKQFHSGQGGVGDISCIYCPKPELSAEARKKKMGGVVLVEAIITAEGRAIHTRVVLSRGSQLDEQAVEVVKGWKFKPAANGDGKPVPVSALLEVVFRSN